MIFIIILGVLYIEQEAFTTRNVHFTNPKLSVIQNTPETRIFGL